jgi:hypothetical protein
VAALLEVEHPFGHQLFAIAQHGQLDAMNQVGQAKPGFVRNPERIGARDQFFKVELLQLRRFDWHALGARRVVGVAGTGIHA